jgi:hypothetical protein
VTSRRDKIPLEDAEVGVFYAVSSWDPEEPHVVGATVRGRLAAKGVKFKVYPGDRFWLIEEMYMFHLVDEQYIQEVYEIRRW